MWSTSDCIRRVTILHYTSHSLGKLERSVSLRCGSTRVVTLLCLKPRSATSSALGTHRISGRDNPCIGYPLILIEEVLSTPASEAFPLSTNQTPDCIEFTIYSLIQIISLLTILDNADEASMSRLCYIPII